MQTMAELPDDAITQLKPFLFKNSVKIRIKRKNLTIIHVIAHLPADASIIFQNALESLDNAMLPR